MTESELCGSSFDWESGSPSVFLRPMNPALSAQHFFPEDSPVILEEKDIWRRNGSYMTPASPLFGSISYMSQESSCCSALNNAVIMEDDDNETIPTDERPSLVPVSAPEDVSPIVSKSFNVSDLPAANVTTTTNTSIPLATQSMEDRSNSSSLQELLYNGAPTVDVAFIGNSPGPQWSPGIRTSAAGQVKSPSPSLIRIDNFLDASPSLSPKKGMTIDSSLSISAILPAIIETPAEEDQPVTSTHRDVDKKPRVFDEPSPVRRLTHQRSTGMEPIRLPDPIRPAFNRSSYLIEGMTGRSFQQRQPLTARKTILSTEERELKEAEDGRKRLMAQIRINRRSLEVSRASDVSRYSRIQSPSILEESRHRSFSASRIETRSPRLMTSTLAAAERLRSRLAANQLSSSILRSSSLDQSMRKGPVKVQLMSKHPTSIYAPPLGGSRPTPRLTTVLYTAHRRGPTSSSFAARPAWR
jgi:hypothetical protein